MSTISAFATFWRLVFGGFLKSSSCSSKAFTTLIYSKTSEIFVASNQASFCFNTIL